MSILRFDPFRDLDRLADQLVSGTRTPSLMPMDVWRAGDAYEVSLDLPGIDPSTLELTVERGTLSVRAERRSPFPEGAQVVVAERPAGASSRSLVLGDGVDVDAVSADYADGVLHLRIPLKASTQPRRIHVEQTGRGEPSQHAIGQSRGEDAVVAAQRSSQEQAVPTG